MAKEDVVQVYHALRAGFIDVAIKAADVYALSASGCHHVASELPGWLQTWKSGGRTLPASTASDITRAAVALVQSSDLEKHGEVLARPVVLILCALGASVKPLIAATSGAQALLPGSGVTSIEDWMWLRCSVVYSQQEDGVHLRHLKDGVSGQHAYAHK